MRKFLFLCLILLLAAPAFAIDLKDVELGGKVQLRGYSMENFWDFSDDNNGDRLEGFRTYTSLQTKLKTSDDVSGFIKLSNQNWGSGLNQAFKVKDSAGDESSFTVGGESAGENKADNVFVDNAYIDVNNLWCLPKQVNLRLGRQNVMYGTGFVMFDGQSQYASTSLYFDGVKATVKFDDRAILDALYLKDQENSIFAPPVGSNPSDDITLSGAYFTGKCPVIATEKGQQELYMLNRNDQNLNKDIWMGGLRMSDKFGDLGPGTLDYSAELAYQFGDFNEKADIDQDAWGTKDEIGYTLSVDPLTPRFFLGYAFMEGDDPDTQDSERWDVFYGGWPQWGDLLAWKYVNVPGNDITNYDANWKSGSSVGGEAVYSNLQIATVGISSDLSELIRQDKKILTAGISYSMLTVDRPDPGKDDDFGDYYQLNSKYTYSPNLDFSVYAAMIDPGDAFVNNDKAYEVYWETALKF